MKVDQKSWFNESYLWMMTVWWTFNDDNSCALKGWEKVEPLVFNFIHPNVNVETVQLRKLLPLLLHWKSNKKKGNHV